MRTLIVSDLHLGLRSGIDVLRQPLPRERLLDALDQIDRLVLLGDVLELGRRRPAPAADPVLRQLGARLGPEREVVIVPGNHDRGLVRAWARSRGGRLGSADEVDPASSSALATVAGWLSPAQVRVSYPGVWLDDRVWATHGHYLNRHLIPETSFGLPRRPLRTGGRQRRPSAAIDYERGWRRRGSRRRGGRDGLAERILDRPLATALESAAGMTRMGAIRRVPRLMMRANLAPVTARLIDVQMRLAAMPAMAEVARRLELEADWIVFGHAHRLGPRDEPAWQPWADGPRLVNTGAWVFEPMLLDGASPPHPYWPGGAVLLEPGAAPRPIGLLDDLRREQLTADPSGAQRRIRWLSPNSCQRYPRHSASA